MKGGLGNIMKQAQAMQDNIAQAQKELASIEVVGQSGGGLVRCTMTCRHDVKSLHIDDSLLAEGDDKEVLEDLIAAAMNDAVRKVEKTSEEKMSSLGAGLNIPGFKMPF